MFTKCARESSERKWNVNGGNVFQSKSYSLFVWNGVTKLTDVLCALYFLESEKEIQINVGKPFIFYTQSLQVATFRISELDTIRKNVKKQRWKFHWPSFGCKGFESSRSTKMIYTVQLNINGIPRIEKHDDLKVRYGPLSSVILPRIRVTEIISYIQF